MDKKSSFVPNPLTEKELEARRKKILSGANLDSSYNQEITEEDEEKVKIKPILMRVPITHYKQLLKIKKLTGLTMNGVCVDLIWTAIKLKLKELEEE